jgi:hypothetical protein
MALKTRKAIQVQNVILQDLHQMFLELEIPVSRPFVSNNETDEDIDGQTYIVVKKDDFEDYLVLWLTEYADIKHPVVSIVFSLENDSISHIHNAEEYYFWKHGVLKEKINKILGV